MKHPSERDPWPPIELNDQLAQLGRVILHFNALERSVRTALRQFIVGSAADRIVFGLCDSLNGVELENNLRRFAHFLEKDHGATGCEAAFRHLITLYQNGKSLRNRIVHELSDSWSYGNLHLHKHTFSPDYEGKGLLLIPSLLTAIVDWLSEATHYAALTVIELGFVRGFSKEADRKFMPSIKAGWPQPISVLTWKELELTFKDTI